MSDIPDWAIERAKVLAGYTSHHLESIRAFPSSYGWLLAFARYIAEHEEAPADPLLIEARRLCAEIYPAEAEFAPFEPGNRDTVSVMRLALAAIKRGIEIGGAK